MRRMGMPLLFLTLMLKASAGTMLFREDFSRGLSNGWQNVAFFKKLTDYSVRPEGTNFYVLAVADQGCSALTHKLALAPGQMKLRWRWRIEGVATNGSESELDKFDHAARVFVAFDSFLGPPYSLNYLWANVDPVGTVREHPKSSRAQLIMVESGNARAGQWITEERDVTADWQQRFPGKPMPKVVGVGLMTDGDSLGRTLTGAYAEIELRGE